MSRRNQRFSAEFAQKPNVSLRIDGPTKRYVSRPAEWKIIVKNDGAKVQFIFERQALKEGDARFRVEYTSELNLQPIYEEAPTRLVVPFAAPVSGGPMPLPPGEKK